MELEKEETTLLSISSLINNNKNTCSSSITETNMEMKDTLPIGNSKDCASTPNNNPFVDDLSNSTPIKTEYKEETTEEDEQKDEYEKEEEQHEDQENDNDMEISGTDINSSISNENIITSLENSTYQDNIITMNFANGINIHTSDIQNIITNKEEEKDDERNIDHTLRDQIGIDESISHSNPISFNDEVKSPPQIHSAFASTVSSPQFKQQHDDDDVDDNDGDLENEFHSESLGLFHSNTPSSISGSTTMTSSSSSACVINPSINNTGVGNFLQFPTAPITTTTVTAARTTTTTSTTAGTTTTTDPMTGFPINVLSGQFLHGQSPSQFPLNPLIRGPTMGLFPVKSSFIIPSSTSQTSSLPSPGLPPHVNQNHIPSEQNTELSSFPTTTFHSELSSKPLISIPPPPLTVSTITTNTSTSSLKRESPSTPNPQSAKKLKTDLTSTLPTTTTTTTIITTTSLLPHQSSLSESNLDSNKVKHQQPDHEQQQQQQQQNQSLDASNVLSPSSTITPVTPRSPRTPIIPSTSTTTTITTTITTTSSNLSPHPALVPPPSSSTITPHAASQKNPMFGYDHVQLYIERDTLHKTALTRQREREDMYIKQKTKERDIEFKMKQKFLKENNSNGTRWRIVYGRNGQNRFPEFQFSSEQLKNVAIQEENLVPIRLDLEFEGIRLRDTFTWNLNENIITPETFATALCSDLMIPSHLFVPAIAKSIHEQIEDYRVHAPEGISIGITGSGRGLLLDHDKDISSLSSLSASSISRYNIEMENRHGHDNLFIGELRVLIKLDITIGSYCLLDQFEWDLNCKNNSPERFAFILANELGLGTEFITAISHSIREQLHLYAKSLLLIGHTFDGSPIIDDELRDAFLPSLDNGYRIKKKGWEMMGPSLMTLRQGEVDRLEREMDRDARRKKRQTNRSRRAVALPDREPPKTNRTQLYSCSIPYIRPDKNTLHYTHPPVNPSTLGSSYHLFLPPSNIGMASAGGGVAAIGSASSSSFSSTNHPGLSNIHYHPTGTTTTTANTGRRGSQTISSNMYTTPEKNTDYAIYNSTMTGTLSQQQQHYDGSPLSRKKMKLVRGIDMKEIGSNHDTGSSSGGGSIGGNLDEFSSTSTSSRRGSKNQIESIYCSHCGALSVDKSSQLKKSSFAEMILCQSCGQYFTYQTRKTSSASLHPPNQTGSGTSSVRRGRPRRTSTQATPRTTPPPPPSSSSTTITTTTISQDQSSPPIPDWLNYCVSRLKSLHPNALFTPYYIPTTDQPSSTTSSSSSLLVSFSSNHWKIRCFDCPEKGYSIGPANTLNNFAIHLKNKGHLERIEERLRQGGEEIGQGESEDGESGGGEEREKEFSNTTNTNTNTSASLSISHSLDDIKSQSKIPSITIHNTTPHQHTVTNHQSSSVVLNVHQHGGGIRMQDITGHGPKNDEEDEEEEEDDEEDEEDLILKKRRIEEEEDDDEEDGDEEESDEGRDEHEEEEDDDDEEEEEEEEDGEESNFENIDDEDSD